MSSLKRFGSSAAAGCPGSTGASVGELRQLLDVFTRGLVRPVFDARYAMSDIGRAFDRLENGSKFGKVSLVV